MSTQFAYFSTCMLILSTTVGTALLTTGTTSPLLVQNWDVHFNPSDLMGLSMGDSVDLEIRLNKSEIPTDVPIFVHAEIDDSDILIISPNILQINRTELEMDIFPIFTLTADLLGKTKIRFLKIISNVKVISKDLDVTVNRRSGPLHYIFTYSVAVLLGVMFINMGAALDMDIVIETIKKPIGPAIGFVSQFLIMPLLGYALAKLLITNDSLQLGLFVTACSPGGGSSNMWTLALGGSLDLSITMTTISTFMSFFMIPLWILTLGTKITNDASLKIPFQNIGILAVSLVVPIIIGIMIKKKLPKMSNILVKVLKPFAAILLIYLIVFGIYLNWTLFRLFTWQVVLAGALLPWLGYLLGGGTAYLLRQNKRDIIAIAIETGIQNYNMGILILRFSLPQPEADLTTVLPVAVAIMTPIVPLIILIIQKIWCRKVEVKKQRLELAS